MNLNDCSYETLFVDIDGRKTRHIQGFRLERFVRAWYPTATDASEYPLEELVASGGRGDDAMDFLLDLLCQARNEVDAESPTLVQCCEELASWGQDYENCFGCRVIEWTNGSRTVHWGSGEEYTWTSLGPVLESVADKNGEPGWWQSEWTEHEDLGPNGQRFLNSYRLPAGDPRRSACVID